MDQINKTNQINQTDRACSRRATIEVPLGLNGFPQSVRCGITSQDTEKCGALTRIIHDGSSRDGGVARDSHDVWALFLPVALVSPESGIGD
ncbi:MAG TPA: hypothetical protein VIW48_03900, partial [Nitrospiraceae bacterium]